MLEAPAVDKRGRGEQRHFLSRLDRLPGGARELALRFYYNHGLTRFVARRALGLSPGILERDGAPEGRDPPRVVLDLEKGAHPSRLMVDAAGHVITCLAADMEAGVAAEVPFSAVTAEVREYASWLAGHVAARELAGKVDLFRLWHDVKTAGWWAPRESIEIFRDLGPAGSILLLELLRIATLRAIECYGDAVAMAGSRNDRALREWFRATGAVTACLVVLSAIRACPDRMVAPAIAGVPDLILPMVFGACLARWRRDDGEQWLDPLEEGAPPIPYISYLAARATYFGGLRRLAPEMEDREGVLRRANAALDKQWRELDEAVRRETGPDGESYSPLRTFLRDLTKLALERGEPDWGADWAGDPRALPPLRVDDLCLPGAELSLRAPRHLAQRLLCGRSNDLTSMFCTRRELRQWRERLGDPDKVRPGTFRMPFVRVGPPTQAAPAPAGRNDPCPCGSGVKFKRCCLGKAPSGPEEQAPADG